MPKNKMHPAQPRFARLGGVHNKFKCILAQEVYFYPTIFLFLAILYLNWNPEIPGHTLQVCTSLVNEHPLNNKDNDIFGPIKASSGNLH